MFRPIVSVKAYRLVFTAVFTLIGSVSLALSAHGLPIMLTRQAVSAFRAAGLILPVFVPVLKWQGAPYTDLGSAFQVFPLVIGFSLALSGAIFVSLHLAPGYIEQTPAYAAGHFRVTAIVAIFAGVRIARSWLTTMCTGFHTFSLSERY